MWPLIHTTEPYSSDWVKRTKAFSGLTSATAPHEAKVVETCYLVLHHTWGVPQLCGVVLIVPCHNRDNGPIRYVAESNHLLEPQQSRGGGGGVRYCASKSYSHNPWCEMLNRSLSHNSCLKKIKKYIHTYHSTKMNSFSVKDKKQNWTSVSLVNEFFWLVWQTPSKSCHPLPTVLINGFNFTFHFTKALCYHLDSWMQIKEHESARSAAIITEPNA